MLLPHNVFGFISPSESSSISIRYHESTILPCQDNERNQMKPILGTLGAFPICSSIHGYLNWSCTLAVAGSLTYTQACRCHLDPDANSFWQMTLGLLDNMAVPFPVLERDFLPFSLMIKLIFFVTKSVWEFSFLGILLLIFWSFS